MEYQIVQGFLVTALGPTLAQKVNAAIAEGWTPTGGIAHVSGAQPIFGQAMTRALPET